VLSVIQKRWSKDWKRSWRSYPFLDTRAGTKDVASRAVADDINKLADANNDTAT
jgi:hypothetical protein